MLYHLLYPIHDSIGFFRVFRYITFRTAACTLTALFICFVIGPWVIRVLSRRQVGQQVRDDGPLSHLQKQGTPTMGGILILFALVLSVLLWARLDNPYVWVTLYVTLGMGGIGFLDDYLKIAKKNSKGLKGRSKLLLQSAVTISGIGFIYLCSTAPTWLPSGFAEIGIHADTKLYVPFFKEITPYLGLMFIPWALVVMLGTSNSVNLTDGLDGLAIGPIMIAAITYLIFSYAAGHVRIADYLQVANIIGAGELAVVCGAMFGASLGFLWFNTYPAQVFMGDVGSLALGGMLGAIAMIIKQEIMLILVGGIFVLEALSVMAQVTSYQLFGKRIFRMAPIHHHFELKGWAEPKVIVRFWIISIILSLMALSSLKLR